MQGIRCCPLRAVLPLVLSAWGVQAAPLTPASGALTVSGRLGDSGRFEIRANLAGGNFHGNATFEIDGQTLSAPLLPKRSYLENGQCHFRIESGPARAELGGPCDSVGLRGRFESFVPGQGMRSGGVQGQVMLATQSVSAEGSSNALPAGKLSCAYMEPVRSFKLGETTQYLLRWSNLVSLTLSSDGHYRAGASASGEFVRQNGAIRLISGPWIGALARLETDRSGQASVVFYIDQNRRPDGVHIVDPYTTRCSKSR